MNQKKKLIIIGASGHGRVVADIAKNVGYVDITFLDDKGNRGYEIPFRSNAKTHGT